LHLSLKQHAFEILTHIGPQLKELQFKSESIYLRDMDTNHFDVMKTFVLCPNLEVFSFNNNYNGEINFQMHVVPNNLKLKRFNLLGWHIPEGFLPHILSVPLLEEANINTFSIHKRDLESLKMSLWNGAIFQNVTRVEFENRTACLRVQAMYEMRSLAKHMIALRPKLDMVDVGNYYKRPVEPRPNDPSYFLPGFYERQKAKNDANHESIRLMKPFMDLLVEF